MDVTTVTAGLLHDVVEDTAATKDDLEREFGGEIAELVDGVTKLGKIAFTTREERQAENFRKMLVAMARDLRVILIKLADRLHNMRTLDYLPPEKAKQDRAGDARHLRAARPPPRHPGSRPSSRTWPSATSSPRPTSSSQRRVAKRRREREADIDAGHRDPRARSSPRWASSRRSAAAPSTSTRSGRRCTIRAASSTRSTTSSRSASSPSSVRDCYEALGRGPLAVEAGARPLQGLHRAAQGQHVPVAPHDGDRAQGRAGRRSRSAPRRCTASPRRASPRTGSTRRSKARQGQARRVAARGCAS